MSTPKRILIVDDSAVMRELLRAVLDDGTELKVVGVASDPIFARQRIAELRPDVLTLDIEMPRMDGLSFLEELMRSTPLPVVMVSSLTERGAQATLRALELGAFDFVTKPTADVRNQFDQMAGAIRAKVRAAAAAGPPRRPAPLIARPKPVGGTAPLVGRAGIPTAGAQPPAAAQAPVPSAPASGAPNAAAGNSAAGSSAANGAAARRRTAGGEPIIAIASSTGGTEALRAVIPLLPADAPGGVIVQHMPEKFTAMFAARLNELSQMSVREARDGDRIERGTMLIAPGGTQCILERGPMGFVIRVQQARASELHNPSANVLFDSVASCVGAQAIGAVLTGMGEDGARGLAAMRRAGARTLAQDQKTSVVYGMPREAMRQGGAEVAVPLDRVAEALLHLAGR
ncbi:MAG: chemotaxis response regulator protein-glutamate methylesterase [Gemmatimonadota bacterium]|nr:chemotaxis response regulator protein-glutamate methylesterase [Gemmatimonadota bacterium]